MTPVRNAVVGAIAMLITAASPGWGEPTRDEIRARNAASQAAVVTLQARVEAAIEFNRSKMPKSAPDSSMKEKYVIDYVRSGSKERFKELEGPLGIRDVIRDSPNRIGSELRQPPVSGSVPTVVLSDSERTFILEIWQWALFELPECKQPLSRLLDEGEILSIKSTTEGDRALIYLSVRDAKDRRYEVWVDPSVNHLVRKCVCHQTYPQGIEGRIEGQVQSFREVKSGVFFPERLVYSVAFQGDWYQKGEAALSNIRVNGVLPTGFFKHPLAPGTVVTDAKKGTIYTLGRDGRPGKSSVVNPSPSMVSVGTSTPATADDERWPWHRIVLLACSLAVATALGVIFWKRRKEAAAA